MGKFITVGEMPNKCRNSSFYLRKTSYPSTYINKEFGNFFDQYNQFESFSSILPMLNEESSFITTHNDLVPKPTPKQSQVALTIALSQIAQIEAEEATKRQQVLRTNQNQGKRQNNRYSKNCLFLHHTYEERLIMFRNDLHNAYGTTFEKSNVNSLQFMVVCRNNPKLKNEVIRRKRPYDQLRRRDFRKSKYQGSKTLSISNSFV